ncbi:hypothetical protein Tco_0097054 [Tanacetum coccineum]
MTFKAQQIELDNALVAPENRHVIGKCNMRINPGMKPKEPTYQVALDALALTTCYPVFLITSEVPVIYMHQFLATVTKYKASYRFNTDNKRFSVNVRVFREILNICPKIPGKEFDEPPSEEEALSFIRELGHSGEIKYITDVIVDHLHQPWRTFASIINKCLCRKETPSKKKPTKVKKDVPSKKKPTSKPKPTKQKAHVKAKRGKGLNVLSEVALSKAAQLKEATKQSKKDFHISQASGSSDGTDFQSGVPDEQHHKTSGADEGTKDDDDDEYDTKDDEGNDASDENDDNDDSDGNNDDDKGDHGNDDDDNDANDDDNQEDDDMNDYDEETDSDRTESDRIKILVLNQSTMEYYEEEEEMVDDEEKMDEEDNEVTKELYKEVNVNLGNKDAEKTIVDQGGADQQNVSQESVYEHDNTPNIHKICRIP